MAAFEYRQALEIRDAFARHSVRYLFIGKAGAILLGFPDTTQDADIFAERSPDNGRALAAALRELGFALTDDRAGDIERGKDFIQLKNGPFDLDLVTTLGNIPFLRRRLVDSGLRGVQRHSTRPGQQPLEDFFDYRWQLHGQLSCQWSIRDSNVPCV